PTVDLHAATKLYVDGKVASSVDYIGGYNASTNTPDLDTSPSGVKKGDMYTVTVAGTFFTTALEVGDVLIAEADDATTEAEWTVVNKDLDAASIKTSYENNADTNAYTDAEEVKVGHISVTQAVNLDTIESDTATNNAKVTNATHTGEVTGSGALTVDKTAISNKGAVTAVDTDYVLIGDTSDANNLKKALVSDLTGGGGSPSITEEDDTCPVTNASTNFNITLGSAPTGGIAGIVSVSINGVSMSAAELISVTTTTMVLNVPYAVDANDVVATRYF
ncbi:MAG: hypothetical protein U9O94_07435, partial [Nanoarchaeota archaeon]|nr:hypothetical protein [Nanoarchaeota archaeon]